MDLTVKEHTAREPDCSGAHSLWTCAKLPLIIYTGCNLKGIVPNEFFRFRHLNEFSRGPT